MACSWPYLPFEIILDVPLRNGLTRPKSVRGTGIKMVNMGELFANQRIGNIDMERVTVSNEEAKRYLLEPGDLLFARQSLVLSGAGKCSIFQGASEPVTFEGHLIRARINQKKAVPDFYYYFFSSWQGRKAIESIVEQVAAAGIRGSDLAKLEVPFPPIAEQNAIARMLGVLDDKIELNRRMNETLEAMARTIFKSWFVDFDPVCAKMDGHDIGLPKQIADLFPDSFQDSTLGPIPLGWDTKSVWDCANYVNGSAFRSEDFSSDKLGLPIIKIGELKDGITAQTKFTENVLDVNYRISSGDILFSWSGSPDTSIDIFIWTKGDGWLNQHIFRVEPMKKEAKLFVYWLLLFLRPVFIEIARDKQTTGLGHVTGQDLRRLKTIFPTEPVLQAFNEIAKPLFDRIFVCKQESDFLATLRDTLLPKLLTGEIRLKDAKEIVECLT